MPTQLPAAYTTLFHKVRQTLIAGQQRIEAEKVRIYWETGQLIQAHIKQNKERAEYGAEVVNHLANDLHIHPRLLLRCVQFAKVYRHPPIVSTRTQFTWSHYRELMSIPDQKEREKLEERLAQNNWSVDELAERIKSGNFRARPLALTQKKEAPLSRAPLTPTRGQVYTYRLVERPTLGTDGKVGGLLVGLGFGVFCELPPRAAAKFSVDQIVESRAKDEALGKGAKDSGHSGYTFLASGRSAKDLFTYNAYLERVVDGDTLKVRFDLGFSTWTRQTLRLRGLDCPEMDTPAGRSAKAFVQMYIKDAAWVVVRSSRSDKYDRYLADVFIPRPDGAEVYLNNLLLENGHAVRMAG